MKKLIHHKIIHWTYYLVTTWLFLQILGFLYSLFQAIHAHNHAAYFPGVNDNFSFEKINTWLIHPLFIITVLTLLSDILRTLKKNILFTQSLIVKTKWIGYVCLVYTVIKVLLPALQILYDDTGIHPFLTFIFFFLSGILSATGSLCFGLMVLLVAYIFQYGMEVQKEKELTV